jgi:hypothetical protein
MSQKEQVDSLYHVMRVASIVVQALPPKRFFKNATLKLTIDTTYMRDIIKRLHSKLACFRRTLTGESTNVSLYQT